ncbi:hypothetical protein SAPIO_CDS2084 [Scedosporium apiospermum]|uniref:Uncharacterized protein n=1 Tax=Pseudallescheria apiosperma TaxID=563466 RepID=A0A084GD75_PSEDA|nr:uncharacterized protein SAPIO_CDS2084 [Scedosporium apiospermum]KEZ45287.1 hypothetical protein SAPIO_CDS2084 [Scedosporium apiospermum]
MPPLYHLPGESSPTPHPQVYYSHDAQPSTTATNEPTLATTTRHAHVTEWLPKYEPSPTDSTLSSPSNLPLNVDQWVTLGPPSSRLTKGFLAGVIIGLVFALMRLVTVSKYDLGQNEVNVHRARVEKDGAYDVGCQPSRIF